LLALGHFLIIQTGDLALSRALGDFEFKENCMLSPEDQIVTANPDITSHERTGEDEFIVLACDGDAHCHLIIDITHVIL